MSEFTTPLVVEKLDDGWWELRESFSYRVGYAEGVTITVPVGFKTDFASIPRLAQPLIGNPAGQFGKAAVIHDYLYQTGIVSKVIADAIFYEAMLVLGVPGWKAKVMWTAVATRGGEFYKGPK